MYEKQSIIRYRVRNRSPLLRENFFPWGLLALLLIVLPLLYALLWYAKNHIQETVQTEVKQALVAHKLDWVDVDVDGQAVTLSGQGTKQEGDRAISIAEKVKQYAWFGRFSAPSSVTGVFSESVKAGSKPSTKIVDVEPLLETDVTEAWGNVKGVLDSGVLTLTGVIGSQAEKEALLTAAGANIEHPRLVTIIDELVVSEQGLKAASAQLAERVSNVLSLCDSGQSSSVDGVFTLQCQAAREQVESLRSSALLPISDAEIGLVAISGADDCNASFVQTLDGKSVGFSIGSANLKPSSAALLDEIAEIAKSCPGSIRVEGHTDKTGSLEGNMALSEARAKAVVEALIERGVTRERLFAEGFGPTQPRAEGDTRQAYALNRRIEFHVSE